MNYSLIQVVKENNIGKIIFNNGQLNVLNIPMMKEINQALDDLLQDNQLKALVIGHTGKFFSAGVDVADHMGGKAEIMLREFHTIFKKLNKFKCPTIAQVSGSALGGGCEVAIFCDLVIASEKAKFGQPEIKVGVFPPIAAIVLPQIISQKKAYDLLLLGETITSQEALDIGLVNYVFSLESFEENFNTFLNRFQSLSTVVIHHTKIAIKKAIGEDFDNKIDDIESYYLKELMKTHDANEGLQAFLDKRPPNWNNN